MIKEELEETEEARVKRSENSSVISLPSKSTASSVIADTGRPYNIQESSSSPQANERDVKSVPKLTAAEIEAIGDLTRHSGVSYGGFR